MFLSSPAKTFDRESKKEGIRKTEEGKKRGSIDNMVANWRRIGLCSGLSHVNWKRRSSPQADG